MTPITLGERTFFIEAELAAYLDTTEISILNVQFPSDFELTPGQISALSTISTGFLANITPSMAYKILLKNTDALSGAQLGVLQPDTFNKIHEKLTQAQLNAIPLEKLSALFNPSPDTATPWEINIAKWLRLPDAGSIHPIFSNWGQITDTMNIEAWSFISPDLFATVNAESFINSFAKESFLDSLTTNNNIVRDTLSHLTNLQIRQIPADAMSTILEQLFWTLNSQGDFYTLSTGFLGRLSPEQQKTLSKDVLSKLNRSAFQFMEANALAALFLAWTEDQLKALPHDLFRLLDDAVYDAIKQIGVQTASDLVRKIVPEGRIYLANRFFEGTAPGLEPAQRSILDAYSPERYRGRKDPYIKLFSKITPGDAGEFHLDFFKNMKYYIEKIPPLFFKNVVPDQMRAIPIEAIGKITREQLLAMGDKILAWNFDQFNALDGSLVDSVDPEISKKILMKNVQETTTAGSIMEAELAVLKEGLKHNFSVINVVAQDPRAALKYWDFLNSQEKAHLIYAIVCPSKHLINFLDVLTTDQLINIDPAVARFLVQRYKLDGIFVLTEFIKNLSNSPKGAEVISELFRKGFADESYRLVKNSIEYPIGSANKYDAQIFIVVGDEARQLYDALGFAYKMPDTVPTLIYKYDNGTKATTLLSTVNGKIDGVDKSPGQLLNEKKNIRTYLLGHGASDKLLIGLPVNASQSGHETGLTPTETYRVVTQLWNDLSPHSSAGFVKLSILGCQLASPLRRTDPTTGLKVPNGPDDWNTRFSESFLGQISPLFLEAPDTPYRAKLSISAFLPLTGTPAGRNLITPGNDPTKTTHYFQSSENKIVTRWNAQENRLVCVRSGNNPGMLIEEHSLLQSNAAYPINTLYMSEEDLHENLSHQLALAFTDPELSENNRIKDTRGVSFLSHDEDLDGNRILVLQQNSEDGDLPSRHHIWDVEETSGSEGAIRVAKNLKRISITGKGPADARYHLAMKELQNLRKGIAQVTANTEAVMKLPDFTALSATDQQRARILISSLSGVVPEADYNSLKARHGSIIKALEALVVRKVEYNLDMDRQAELALSAITAMDAAESKIFLTSNALVSWGADNSASLNMEKLRSFIIKADTIERFRLMAAFLRLDEASAAPLLQKFKSAQDADLKKLGAKLEQQRKAVAQSKIGVADRASDTISNAVEIYSVIIGIFQLAKGWNTSTDAQKALDLTDIIGGTVSGIASTLMMKTLQQTTKTLAGAGMSLTSAMKITMAGFLGVDFALAAVTLASVGLQWSDFWESGQGMDSYAYKSLVASTVTTVVFTAMGLALGVAGLAASLSTIVAASIIGTIAASAGPIGAVIAVAAFLINGIVQGALLISEYHDYYSNDAERVEQFFASWIGIETSATKWARARKQGLEAAVRLGESLNNGWAKTRDFLEANYHKEGYRQLNYFDKKSVVKSVIYNDSLKVGGPVSLQSVSETTTNTPLNRRLDVNSLGENASYNFIPPSGNDLPTVFLGDNVRDTTYTAQGNPYADNLFDLRGSLINSAKSGEKNNTFLLDRSTTLMTNPVLDSEGCIVGFIDARKGENAVNLDARDTEVTVSLLLQNNLMELIFDGPALSKERDPEDSSINLNNHQSPSYDNLSKKKVQIKGNVDQLLIFNALKVTVGTPEKRDYPSDQKGVFYNISGVENADIIIYGEGGSNVFTANEGIQIYSRSQDALFWDGKCNTIVHLESGLGITQQLFINFSGDYRHLAARRSDHAVELLYGDAKLSIRNIYQDNGRTDASKIVAIRDRSGLLFSLNALAVMGGSFTKLTHLSKTFIYPARKEVPTDERDSVTGDQSVNTYSFFKGAGNFILDSPYQHLQQLVLESDPGKLRYKSASEDELLLECEGQQLSVEIFNYRQLYEKGLLRVWIKDSTGSKTDFTEMELPDPEAEPNNEWVSYQEPVGKHSGLTQADPERIIELQKITVDQEITATALAAANNKLHVSIPENADPNRIIQCRQKNDLILYLAESGIQDEITGRPPGIIVREVFRNNSVLKMALHQNFREKEAGAYDLEPHHTKEQAINIPANKEIKGQLAMPGDEDWYVFPLSQAVQYDVGITINTGNCELESIMSSNGLPIRAGNGGSMFPRSNQRSFSIGSHISQDKMYLRVFRSPDDPEYVECSYTLQVLLPNSVVPGAAVVQSAVSYIPVPRVSKLLLYPTRLLGHNSPEMLDGTAYAVVSSNGSTVENNYHINMGSSERSEWTVDNTTIDNLTDTLELTGNIRFSDLRLAASGQDVGLSATVDGKIKTVWIKDFNKNSAVRALSIRLPHYTKAGDTTLDFVLPVYEPVSNWWGIPNAPQVAVTGTGYYLLTLNPDVKQCTKLLVTEAFYLVAKDGAKREKIGQDLRISTDDGSQVLYLKNYYSCPFSVEIIPVEEVFNTNNPAKNLSASPLPVLGRYNDEASFILPTGLENDKMRYKLARLMYEDNSGELSLFLGIIQEYLRNYDGSLSEHLLKNNSIYFQGEFGNTLIEISRIKGLKADFESRDSLEMTANELAVLGTNQTPQQLYNSELITLNSRLASLNFILNKSNSNNPDGGANESVYNAINDVNIEILNLKQKIINLYIEKFNAKLAEKNAEISNTQVSITTRHRKALKMLLAFAKVAQEKEQQRDETFISFVSDFISQYLSDIQWDLPSDKTWTQKDAAFVLDMQQLGVPVQCMLHVLRYNLTLMQVKAYSKADASWNMENFKKFVIVVSDSGLAANGLDIPRDMQEWGISKFTFYMNGLDKNKAFTALLEAQGFFEYWHESLSRNMTQPGSEYQYFLIDPFYVYDIQSAFHKHSSTRLNQPMDVAVIGKFAQALVTSFDIKTNNTERLQYERGKRNHLIAVTASEGLGSQPQASYRIMRSEITGEGSILKRKSREENADFRTGYITDNQGMSPLPEHFRSAYDNIIMKPDETAKWVGHSDLYFIHKKYQDNSIDKSLFWIEKTPAGMSWDDKSLPANLVNGEDKPGGVYAWRPAVHYGIDGNPLALHFDISRIYRENSGPYLYNPWGSVYAPVEVWRQISDSLDYVDEQGVFFEFRNKILLTQMNISCSLSSALKDNPAAESTCTCMVYAYDPFWKRYRIPVSQTFSFPGNTVINVPLNTRGIPYEKYELRFEGGTYHRDWWIKEVTFDTAKIE
ncbi:hypothetical protein [Chryseobacterium populi]|uniref:Peptidase C80 domain-containing protein n=1 Tax=Chryseobacterium populi TaxID=1144316 RepID=J3CEE8_9FLAO|nr:hypothetical protein [Chryseobacterium populi]EJL69984.1 hypothetical protein PMI13_02993 [Chryseobacterium populi]